MHQRLLAVLMGTSMLATTAYADQKSDAQAKLDAAKAKTCEKIKKFILDQEAKGKCKPEADEAKNLTCSAQTFSKMNELNASCLRAKPASDKPTDKADGEAPKCTVTKAAGKDANIDVPVTKKIGAEVFCKTQGKKAAEKFVADNAACEAGKPTFKLTVAFGPPGKEKTSELSGYCPKKK